jgi:hypothetical protein
LALVFTQLAADNFQRAPEDPLDNGVWTTLEDSPCQITSPGIVQSDNNASGGGLVQYTGITWPTTNQWAEVSIGNFNVDNGLSFLSLGILSTVFSGGGGLRLEVTSGGGFMTAVILDHPGDTFTVLARFPPGKSGDTYRLASLGNTWFLLHNGVQIGSGETTMPTGGGVVVQLSPYILGGEPASDVQITNFVGGSVGGTLVYSEPDARSYGNFPNTGRSVNATITYDVPSSYSLEWWFDTLYSRSQPLPEDSRAAGPPVACGTYPQNSRAPGTYGPGE